MPQPTCYDCLYSHWDRCPPLIGPWSVFPSRPACANHPDTPGQMRPVPLGGVCRNYQPRPAPPNLTDGTIKQIPVGRGQYVYVDAADYEWLSRYKWQLYGYGYAARNENGKTIFMHREIMQAPAGMVVDHIDGNPQNCYRANLRVCTQAENVRNTIKRTGTSSRFKGVSRKRGKWRATIRFGGMPVEIAYLDDEVEAARAYDRKAVELGLEFAWLNFPHEWPPERRAQAYADAQGERETLLAKAEAKKRRESRQKKAKNQKAKSRAKTKGTAASVKAARRAVRKRPPRKAKQGASSAPKQPRRRKKKAARKRRGP